MSKGNNNSGNNNVSVITFMLRVFEGMLVGVGGVIPGLSGGVMCAIFGIYQPLMEVLAHPKQNLKKYWKMLLPVILGVVVGFVVLSKLVLLLFNKNEELAVCLFIGLILGMMPSLWFEAEEKGKSKGSYIAMGTAFAILFAILTFFSLAADIAVKPSRFWDAMSGVFWGIGFIVPGASASTPLMFLHLYDEAFLAMVSSFFDHALEFVKGVESFAEAISGMQWIQALFFFIGLVGFVALFARPVDNMLKKHPGIMYHAIFGIVAATTLPIVIFQIDWASDILPKILCVIGGFIAAFALDKFSSKFAPKEV